MIKNLIFDLGDVIIDLDALAAQNALTHISGQAAQYAYATHDKKPDFLNDFEKGWLNNEEFRQKYRDFLQTNIDDNALDKVWNAILGNFPLQRLTLIDELNQQKKYRTFLLSNTNSIHIPEVENILQKNSNHQYQTLQTLFEKVYYSQEMGMRKPDSKIYEQVLKENNLNANETAFFDDNFDNIQSAKSINIHSFLIVPQKNEIIDFFEKDNENQWTLKNIYNENNA
ncbi:MAG: HAD family phosphatase [Bacteroidetes bacterium]|nr:MAG: HAD family phosphatase [Bacteroidota bacterium]TAG87562.1 MAG: HAD family phosphatase [Bacteroidota bacterium]